MDLPNANSPFEIRDILSTYFSFLPIHAREEFIKNVELNSTDPDDLSHFWELALTGHEPGDIVDSFTYYKTLYGFKGDKRLMLSYNEPDALIYPFVVKKIFGLLSEKNRSQLLIMAGIGDDSQLIPAMIGGTASNAPALRNAFRHAFLEDINGEMLSFLYSMVYLMGFSSGGESSFLTEVFPEVKNWGGHIIDAGGGSGFASLILSSRGPVTYVDFSPFRKKRAKVINEMAVNRDGFFEEMLDLIDLESGAFGLCLDRSLIPPTKSFVPERIEYYSADLNHLPEEFLGRFDGAILTDVLEHTTGPDGVLENVEKSLKKGGKILITAPTEVTGKKQREMEDSQGLTFPFLLHIEFFSDDFFDRSTFSSFIRKDINGINPYNRVWIGIS